MKQQADRRVLPRTITVMATRLQAHGAAVMDTLSSLKYELTRTRKRVNGRIHPRI